MGSLSNSPQLVPIAPNNEVMIPNNELNLSSSNYREMSANLDSETDTLRRHVPIITDRPNKPHFLKT